MKIGWNSNLQSRIYNESATDNKNLEREELNNTLTDFHESS